MAERGHGVEVLQEVQLLQLQALLAESQVEGRHGGWGWSGGGALLDLYYLPIQVTIFIFGRDQTIP